MKEVWNASVVGGIDQKLGQWNTIAQTKNWDTRIREISILLLQQWRKKGVKSIDQI